MKLSPVQTLAAALEIMRKNLEALSKRRPILIPIKRRKKDFHV